VKNPINNYAIAVAAGSYAHWTEEYEGERGKLTMDFWPLDYNLEKAKKQFPQARSMLKCFEHWFGPFPWYEDGFKLIEVPNNGMEHQSAIAYGNLYENGYRRRDMSGTGLGLKWDFIIVHEAAHEWWGNNITTKDLADMWVHESFANYAEGIYTECLFGKEAGARYTVGSRSGISNNEPIIPAYNVNAEGSGDMYPKGGSMLHTIRQIVNDDEKWRAILRGLNATFWHQTVMGKQVEDYISQQSGIDLSKVFDQYLRNTGIPVFEYKVSGDQLSYRWTGAIPGFNMPMRVMIGDRAVWLKPTSDWQAIRVEGGDIKADVNLYVTPRRVGGP
jgi:aminopeptidase N